MKQERGQERGMLLGAVKPRIQKIRECLRSGEEVEKKVIADILYHLMTTRESELEKYKNAPDNLKEAANVVRMLEIADLCSAAIGLFCNEKEDVLLPMNEETLNAAERLVERIIDL